LITAQTHQQKYLELCCTKRKGVATGKVYLENVSSASLWKFGNSYVLLHLARNIGVVVVVDLEPESLTWLCIIVV